MRFALRLLVVLGTASLTGCSTLVPGLGDSGSLRYRQAMQAQFDRESAQPAEDPSARTVEAHLHEGDQRLHKDERRLALVHYLEARRLAPSDPRPLVRIGFYYLSEDPERSAAIFASVISRSEDSASAHAGLGLARLAQDRLAEARSSFERALEIDPKLPAALNALAVLNALEDDPAAGLAFAQRAFQASPRDAYIVNNLGVAYLRQSDFTRAEESFRTAILLDPSDPALYNNLGYALGRQQRYDEATAAFRRFGDDVAVHNNLGYVHYLNGDFEAAIRHFEAALRSVRVEDRVLVLQNLRDATDRHAMLFP